MSKRFLLLLLVVWNFLLTAAIVWSLTRSRVPDRILKEKLETIQPGEDRSAYMRADTMPLPEGRIAYFMMDSITEHYALVKESAARVRSEGQRMEGNLQREMQKAQARYGELVAKDHTYSTQAELQADQAEVEQLGEKIQRLQMESQEQLDALQARVLSEIAQRIQDFLEEYNKEAGFDFIFSIQSAGQIWVGNEGLDITPAVLAGLNERHRALQGQKK